LRESVRQAGDERFAAGWSAGEEWATSKAEAVELCRLESWREGHTESTWDDLWTTQAKGDCTAADALAFGVYPEMDWSRELSRNFWNEAVGNYPEDPRFVRGFAEGALSVWIEVKDSVIEGVTSQPGGTRIPIATDAIVSHVKTLERDIRSLESIDRGEMPVHSVRVLDSLLDPTKKDLRELRKRRCELDDEFRRQKLASRSRRIAEFVAKHAATERRVSPYEA
jgi:hypothetical protein